MENTEKVIGEMGYPYYKIKKNIFKTLISRFESKQCSLPFMGIVWMFNEPVPDFNHDFCGLQLDTKTYFIFNISEANKQYDKYLESLVSKESINKPYFDNTRYKKDQQKNKTEQYSILYSE